MPSPNLLALFDDVAAMMDDVAVMTKKATSKTLGLIGDDLAVNSSLKDVSTRLKFVAQSPCVGEVSVVGNRYLASVAIHNQWLNILYMGSPGRRIAGVSDRVVALKISQGVALEYLRHQTHFAVRVE